MRHLRAVITLSDLICLNQHLEGFNQRVFSAWHYGWCTQ